MDYFSLFALPEHLRIDISALERDFYSQSRKFHPDRFAAKPAAEQAEALRRSSELNDAYRTLRDPIARTEYLLSLHGVNMEEQSRRASDEARAAETGNTGTEKKAVAPPDLLEEAFELNMQLEEMRMARRMGEDDPATRADLEAANTRFSAMLAETGRDLEELWDRWDAALDAGDAPGMEAAKNGMVALLNRRSYVRNLVRDVIAALEE